MAIMVIVILVLAAVVGMGVWCAKADQAAARREAEGRRIIAAEAAAAAAERAQAREALEAHAERTEAAFWAAWNGANSAELRAERAEAEVKRLTSRIGWWVNKLGEEQCARKAAEMQVCILQIMRQPSAVSQKARDMMTHYKK